MVEFLICIVVIIGTVLLFDGMDSYKRYNKRKRK